MRHNCEVLGSAIVENVSAIIMERRDGDLFSRRGSAHNAQSISIPVHIPT